MSPQKTTSGHFMAKLGRKINVASPYKVHSMNLSKKFLLISPARKIAQTYI